MAVAPSACGSVHVGLLLQAALGRHAIAVHGRVRHRAVGGGESAQTQSQRPRHKLGRLFAPAYRAYYTKPGRRPVLSPMLSS